MQPRSPVIGISIAMHLCLAVLLWFDADAALSPNIAEVARRAPSHQTAALGFALVALLALLGLMRFHGTSVGLLLKSPQQFVLVMGAWGSIKASMTGDAANRHFPRGLVLASQLPVLVVTACHLWILIEIYRGGAFWKKSTGG